MPLEKRNLAEEFEVLADDREAPVSAIDYDRAMTNGRRTLRLRRTAGGLTAVVTVALAATLTGMLPLPGTGGVPAATPPAHGVDPLIVHVEFGWVPSNLTMISYGGTTGNTSVSATAPEPANGSDQSAFVDLTVFTDFSAGRPDPDGTSTQVGTLNGYPVEYSAQSMGLNDSRGYLTPVNPSTCKTEPMRPVPTLAQEGIHAEGIVGLVWHTAAGQIATLSYLYVNQPTPDTATLMHIAETATYAPKAIPMPFSITGVKPAQMFATGQATDLSRFPVDNNLTYNVGDTTVTILADPSPALAPPSCPNAYDSVEADEVINGLHFYVTETSMKGPGAAVDVSKTGTPLSILKRITSYGSDPAKWTTKVLAQ